MPYSAFGIDHGYEEIEKIEMPGFVSRIGEGMASKVTGLGRRAQAFSMRPKAMTATGMAAKTNAGGFKAGGALKRIGAGMAARPGLTGASALGGGVAGVGGGGYAMGRRRNQ